MASHYTGRLRLIKGKFYLFAIGHKINLIP